MFDFPAWEIWLAGKVDLLGRQGLEATFYPASKTAKPKIALGLKGKRAIGQFENWITGETDHTVHFLGAKELPMVHHKWGHVVSDASFEKAFEEFLVLFYDVEAGTT